MKDSGLKNLFKILKRKAKSFLKYYLKYQGDVNNYPKWIKKHEKNLEDIQELRYNPKFSFVVPVYNTVDEQIIACVDSILNQTYKNFELILVDDCSTWESVRKLLQMYEEREPIHVIYRKENGNISEATNTGMEAATGDYIVFTDCDDVVAVNALYEFAKLLNEHPEYDFIYSDEDKLSENGRKRHDPFFKPEWSPDTFMCLNYTNHLSAYRASLVRETGGLRTEYNGSQDYDFVLRFMELSDNKKVGHVPKVLYHWRMRRESTASDMQAKPYALVAMENLKKDALKRRGIKGTVESVPSMLQYRVVYENEENPLISIIIPSKDNYDILMQCLNSIWSRTTYPNYEIVLVDNGSKDEVKSRLQKLADENKITYIYDKKEFNFSYMCNTGVKASRGEYLLFLNDDIEICQDNWLSILVGQASQIHTGAVGAKLYYPDTDLIQHVGVTNLPVGPSHSFLGMSDKREYYYGRNWLNYNVIAVTGACLMLSKAKFMEVGMMDEKLPIAYNDMDLCFSLHDHGYYNVVRNDVQLFHHESVSRGYDTVSEEKMERLAREREYLYSKHEDLRGRDPYYSPNLAVNRVDFAMDI